ncbi:hypothetical protein LZ32DRAFT_411637 [Colletotrichum eremochloae]|nr:hypothetical protein LZ32DRAFT_411637 [Colletotrichum eremochloae]
MPVLAATMPVEEQTAPRCCGDAVAEESHAIKLQVNSSRDLFQRQEIGCFPPIGGRPSLLPSMTGRGRPAIALPRIGIINTQPFLDGFALLWQSWTDCSMSWTSITFAVQRLLQTNHIHIHVAVNMFLLVTQSICLAVWFCGLGNILKQASRIFLFFFEALNCCTASNCSTWSCRCGDSTAEERKRDWKVRLSWCQDPDI